MSPSVDLTETQKKKGIYFKTVVIRNGNPVGFYSVIDLQNGDIITYEKWRKLKVKLSR